VAQLLCRESPRTLTIPVDRFLAPGPAISPPSCTSASWPTTSTHRRGL
jgi:hypothetical protein